MRAWGFAYKTNLAWVKPQTGMGNYFRNAHELCLFGVRGRLPTNRGDILTWDFWPRSKHSKKPETFYSIIEEASPGPYLELFARQRRRSWASWGDEVPAPRHQP